MKTDAGGKFHWKMDRAYSADGLRVLLRGSAVSGAGAADAVSGAAATGD
jgi:hypothetical protein